jgi:hypothetical protein
MLCGVLCCAGGETAIYYNNRGLANLRLERIDEVQHTM